MSIIKQVNYEMPMLMFVKWNEVKTITFKSSILDLSSEFISRCTMEVSCLEFSFVHLASMKDWAPDRKRRERNGLNGILLDLVLLNEH